MKRINAFGLLILFGMISQAGLSAQTEPSSLPEAARVIKYPELRNLIEMKTDFLLLDVRTAEEYASGWIPGAILFPYDELEKRRTDLEKLAAAVDRLIVVYCRSGRRSAIAAETLIRFGYSNVADFGGIGNWKGPVKR